MKKKKIISIFAIIAILVVIIGGGYTRYSLNNIAASNNRQRAQGKLETAKGSKLKIGDYVNYDHTLQVDPNTKETKSVSKEKLTYTSIKGDLDNSGNGVGTQTVDVSGYKTKWRVYDIQGDQVLLMPETQPTAEIKAKSALGYLWWEKEAHNIAGLYGHGYGADGTKEFNYEVGSRIPSEGDTRTETKIGTGARPMLLKDIEEAYGITTDKQRQDYNFSADGPVGSNKLARSIYYPTLNKINARAIEDKTYSGSTGDIGVSKTTKKLTDIKQEKYWVLDKLNQLHTKTYDVKTGKDIQKEIIHKYWNELGSRIFGVNSDSVDFTCGVVTTNYFYSGDGDLGRGINSEYGTIYFEVMSHLRPRPVVFLSSANNYYKEQGSGEYATYSLIKEENEESQHPKIQNPYKVSLKNVSLKGMYADRLLFESKLDASAQDASYTNLTRADGTKVIDNIIYTVEGLPEGITYEVVKKQVDGKEEVTLQIYPKELSVVANVNKTDIYDGAKFNYDVVLKKNAEVIDTKQLNETAGGKVEIAKYTEKKDIIDEEGNAVNYTLDFANFNDTARKDNTYYTNTIAKADNTNSNEIEYDLNIVYMLSKYQKDEIDRLEGIIKKLKEEIKGIKDESSKKDDKIQELEAKIKELEGKCVDQSVVNELNKQIEGLKGEKKQLGEQLDNANKKVAELTKTNQDKINENISLKEELEKLKKEIQTLKEQLTQKDNKIKELQDKIGTLETENNTKQAKIAELEGKIATLEKTVEEKDKSITDLTTKNTNLENEIKELKNDKTANENKIAELEGKISNLNKQNEKILEEKNNINKELENIKEELRKEKEDNSSNKSKVEDLEKKLENLQKRYDELSNTSNTCSTEADKLKGEITDLKRKLNEANTTIDDLKKQIEELKKEKNSSNEKQDELNKTIEELKKRIAELEEKNRKSEETNTENDAIIQDLKKKFEKAEEENKNITEEKDKIEKKLEEANEKIKKLEEGKCKQEELDRLASEIAELKGENEKLKNSLNESAEENKKLLANTNKLKEMLDKKDEEIAQLKKKLAEKDNEISDLKKKNKQLEEKDKLNEEERKEKELLKKKLEALEKEKEELEKEKAKKANEKLVMPSAEKEQKDKEADANANNNNKPSVRNNAVASNSKKNNSKNNTSGKKIPHAGLASNIVIAIATIASIILTKKLVSKKR